MRQIATSARHRQTYGLTERFYGTLKTLLKQLNEVPVKHWDDFIPYFLFSYREVSCETTGYTPFELRYGKQVRGPLSELQETRLNKQSQPDDVCTQLLHMHKRIEKLMFDANQNTEKHQINKKEYYDKSAYIRDFKQGNEVLVFILDGTENLDCK